MIDVSKFIARMILTVQRYFIVVFCLLHILGLSSAYAQSNPRTAERAIQVAENKAKFNWTQGRFQQTHYKKNNKLRKRKKVRTKRRSVRKKTRRKNKRKLKSKVSSRASDLARKNKLLSKKLHLLKQKDVCGYPWVYAYKYKRCICERRGFTQLGSQCVRLSRYCTNGSVWSSIKRKCICKAGFEYQNKKCVNVALLDEDDDDEDDETPPILSGASCSAPANFAALSQSVGECPEGYKPIAGKCTLTQKQAPVIDVAQANVETEADVARKKQQALAVIKAQKAEKIAAAKKVQALLMAQKAKNNYKAGDDAPNVVSSLPYQELNEPVYDLMQIKACLYQAGFRGKGEGKAKYSAFMETYDAFKQFRQRHQLTHKAMDIYDLESQKILFKLCRGGQGTGNAGVKPAVPAAYNTKQLQPLSAQPTGLSKPAYQKRQTVSVNETAGGMVIGSNDGYLPVRVTGATKPFVDPSSKVKACLPSDLYDFLTTTYRNKSGLEKCAKPCLPVPTTMSVADRRAYGEKYNINWCKTCLKVSSYMSLEEVLKVERNAKVQVCTTPATSLQFSAEQPRFIGRSYPKARRLYRDFPESASDVNTIAVIIGNKDYNSSYGKNSNALNDAGAMFSLLSEHLGYASDNIFDLRNATLAKMQTVLGAEGNGQGSLWKRMQQHPQSRVIIYYSGHAMNNATNSQNYLLPIDAVKGREARTGYSISLLLNNLRKLRAASIMLVLETEFGRKTGNAILPPNASEISLQLQSSVPVPGLTIFMASHGNQKALEDPDYGIGLFTRHFISGLAGKADRKPIGNQDGKIDVVELYVHTANMVRLAARKSFGLLQNPTLAQTGNMVISRLKTR